MTPWAPVTKVATLPNKALTPAIALRQLIAAFVAENPD